MRWALAACFMPAARRYWVACLLPFLGLTLASEKNRNRWPAWRLPIRFSVVFAVVLLPTDKVMGL